MVKKYAIVILWIFFVVLLSMVGQFISKGTSFIDSLPISLFIVLLCFITILIKDFSPKSWQFPVFAWAMLLGVVTTVGDTTLARWVSAEAKNIDFLVTTTPLLTFAGISMMDQLDKLKQLSWKIIIIATVVFVSLFFICASTAHLVLKIQGII
ncbi:MAG: hypothetical protein ACRCWI_06180 [Brevinema sp.]